MKLFNSEKEIQEWVCKATCSETRVMTDWDCLEIGNYIVELVYNSKRDEYGILKLYVPHGCKMNENSSYYSLGEWSNFFSQNIFLVEVFSGVIRNSIIWLPCEDIIKWMESENAKDDVLEWCSYEIQEWWNERIQEAKGIFGI